MPPPLTLTLTDKLEPFRSLKKRFKGVFGGRGGTKSQTVADILVQKVHIERIKVGCFREHQNTIEDSVHALLSEEINRMQVPGFVIGDTKIRHKDGGEFKFRGLSRNTGGVKSFHGFKIFWVEEAQFLSKKSLKTITPTLREQDSEFWFTFNPGSRLDPISQRFIMPFIKDLRRQGYYEDALHYIVWTNFDENPWFPEALEQERQFDYKYLPRVEYDHIWRGFFDDTVAGAIIKAEWFDACIDAHKVLGFEPLGMRVVSHDPSDTGYDDKGLALRQGSVILEAKLNKTGDVNEGMDWALSFAIDHLCDYFVWDADGMGLGLKRQVKDSLKGEKIDWHPFRGSETVEDPNGAFEDDKRYVTNTKKQRTNKQALKNLRAQKYWELRTRIYNTFLAITNPAYAKTDPDKLISFSSDIIDIEQLRAEACKIPRKKNPNGMIQIMTKEEMRGLDIDSPNLVDPVMMSLVTPVINDITDNETLNFTNPWS